MGEGTGGYKDFDFLSVTAPFISTLSKTMTSNK